MGNERVAHRLSGTPVGRQFLRPGVHNHLCSTDHCFWHEGTRNARRITLQASSGRGRKLPSRGLQNAMQS